MKPVDDKTKQLEASNLRKLLKGRNMADFARRWSVPGGAQSIYNHLGGKMPISLGAAVAYARGLDVPLSAISMRLADKVGVLRSYIPATSGRIRVVGGASKVDVKEDDFQLAFERGWMDRQRLMPSQLIAIRVTDASMEPSLRVGDTIVINTGDTDLQDDGVFLFILSGTLCVRRLIRSDGTWLCTPDNPNKDRWKPQPFGKSDKVVARVLFRFSAMF